MREYGSQAVVWQTAINPVIALELLGVGRMDRRRRSRPGGVHAAAVPRQLAEYGAPHGVLELVP